MPNEKKPFDPQQLLPVALVAGAALILFVALSDGGGAMKKRVVRDEKTKVSVNEHLRKTAEQIEMQRRQMGIRNWQLANEYGQTVAERAYTPPKEGAELMEDGSAQNVANDLGKGETRPSGIPNNPADLVQYQLFAAQSAQEYSDSYRKEYARQFIENARRGGWEVRLDENYKVISVKPVRTPARQF